MSGLRIIIDSDMIDLWSEFLFGYEQIYLLVASTENLIDHMKDLFVLKQGFGRIDCAISVHATDVTTKSRPANCREEGGGGRGKSKIASGR